MSRIGASLVVHVGYPKTATTTFQKHVFPRHPQINYLGKYIPSFRYKYDALYPLLNDLAHQSRLHYKGTETLRGIIDQVRSETRVRVILISSESLTHPWASDVAVVADRLYEALYPCRIMITIREQISAILSFYWMHGQYGQYLSIGGRNENRRLSTPITFSEWIELQKSAEAKNYISTLHYDRVILYYMSKFGSENVGVFLFETLKTNPERYARQLSNFLGVDPEMIFQLLVGKRENPSSGLSAPWDQSQLDLIARTKLGSPFKTLRSRLMALTSDLGGNHLVGDLRESYREGNAILANRLSLPLKEHGYSL